MLVKRLFTGLFIVLIVVILVVATYLLWTVRRPFPENDGSISLAGLEDEVLVYRDELGVPQIYAESDADLYFAQGFVHAQDRFWQMEFWRHVGQGRLSEILGEDGIDSDLFIRTMGWNRIAALNTSTLMNDYPKVYAILEQYSAGVNAYLDDRDPGEISVGYSIFSAIGAEWEIEPWEPIDTLSWAVVMADNLSADWRSELSRLELEEALGAETVAALKPTYPYGSRPVIAPSADLVNTLAAYSSPPDLPAAIAYLDVNTDVYLPDPLLTNLLGSSWFVGSNSWVVSGEHTASGAPILANDPHLGIQAPAIWYEIGLHSPGLNLAGFSFAGSPGIIIGHNDHIAWGMTNVGTDVQDLFIERVNPSNPDQYQTATGWSDMEIIDEVIKVNGGEDIHHRVRVTQHGPIINKAVDFGGSLLSLQWTAGSASTVMNSLVLLNRAEDFASFREALSFWDVPAQNFVFADVDGNIGYQTPGRIPIRANHDGLRPVPGWDGTYDWQGWVPYEELPTLYNPPTGFIVTANNAVVDEDYPHFLTSYWSDGDRAARIIELLESSIARGKLTQQDISAIQNDSYSMLAASYTPLLTELSSEDSLVSAAIASLREWDLHMTRESSAAAIFAAFFLELTGSAIGDDVGSQYVESLTNYVFLHQLAGLDNSPFWDNQQTAEVESRQDTLLVALESAVQSLAADFGDDVSEWHWADLHTATFVSSPLGASKVSIVESLVNIGPIPVDGSIATVNASSWSLGNPAAVTSHPSMRLIIDMSDFDATLMILPTGQSGHPTNRHYDDMLDMWVNGELHSLPFTEAAVRDAAVATLTLTP